MNIKFKTRKNDNVTDKGVCLYCNEYIQRYPTRFQCDKCYIGLCKRCCDEHLSQQRRVKKNIDLCRFGKGECNCHQTIMVSVAFPVADKVKTYREILFCPSIREAFLKLRKKFKINDIVMIA